VVDVAKDSVVKNINVGLHPAGMTISGSMLYVANSYDGSISVIDTDRQQVVRTIKVGVPVKGGAFGAGVNDIAVVGDKAYVTLGQSNAVAVINLGRGQGCLAFDPDFLSWERLSGRCDP